MTELAILFLVLFVISLIIAVVAIINAIKIDITHTKMLLLREVMLAKAENAELLLEIEKLKKGEEDE